MNIGSIFVTLAETESKLWAFTKGDVRNVPAALLAIGLVSVGRGLVALAGSK